MRALVPPTRWATAAVCRHNVRPQSMNALPSAHDTSQPDAIRLTVTPDAVPPGTQGSASRGRVQAAIRAGHVRVNGRPCTKSAAEVKLGDVVEAMLPQPPQLQALPEAIPLDIVFEDDHVLVINKAAGMVVHPGPGHPTGTLVNAVLAHCDLPPALLQPVSGASCSDEDAEDEVQDDLQDADCAAPLVVEGAGVRPGIVHRLDVGTTGLLVVAKDATSLWRLSTQFKERTVQRTYHAVALGSPSSGEGSVATNVARDLRERKRMAAATFNGARGKPAVSGFSVLEPLAGGAAVLMAWKLETGRTHQIRGAQRMAACTAWGDTVRGLRVVGAFVDTLSYRSEDARRFEDVVRSFGRPALHAKTLGFAHPVTGQWLQFDSCLPDDMQTLLVQLRQM